MESVQFVVKTPEDKRKVMFILMNFGKGRIRPKWRKIGDKMKQTKRFGASNSECIAKLLNVCVAKNVVPAREIGRSVTGDAALIATAFIFLLFSMRAISIFFRSDNERF